MDRFSSLRALVSVVDHGGFAPAARSLGLATSSITRQVDALEAHLHTQLLNRSTRSVSLTDAGEVYLERARLLLEGLAEADRLVSERGTRPMGLLRVSLPVAFARLHVAPLVTGYLAANPDASLELVLQDARADFVEDRLDLAIRIGALEDSALIARKLAPHRRVVCASPDYLESRGTPAGPDDLAHHDCLTFDYAEGRPRWQFSRASARHSVVVGGPLRANNSELLLQAAREGLGVILMPTWLVGPDCRAGKLVPLLTDWECGPGATQTAIYGVYPPNRRGSLKVSAFLDCLAETFGTPPYWELPAD